MEGGRILCKKFQQSSLPTASENTIFTGGHLKGPSRKIEFFMAVLLARLSAKIGFSWWSVASHPSLRYCWRFSYMAASEKYRVMP